MGHIFCGGVMSLKDALMKAGVKSTKTQNMREYTGPKKEQKKSELHQQERNFCEVCQLIHPDVERFKHKNPTVDAEWICSACADREEILDQFRITNQSEFARVKRYRREYGATKDFSEVNYNKEGAHKKEAKSTHGRGDRSNRGPHGQKNAKTNKPNNYRKNDRSNQGRSKKKASYSIDEDGEKNFNC